MTNFLFFSCLPSTFSAPSFTECGEKPLWLLISSLLCANSRSLQSELRDVRSDSFGASGNGFALCPSSPSSTSIFCPESSLRATAVSWWLSSLVSSSKAFTSFSSSGSVAAPSACNLRNSASSVLIIAPSLSVMCCMSACILIKALLNRSEQGKPLFSKPETEEKYR